MRVFKEFQNEGSKSATHQGIPSAITGNAVAHNNHSITDYANSTKDEPGNPDMKDQLIEKQRQ